MRIVAALLALSFSVAGVLAEVAPSDPSQLLTQLGIGAIVAAPFIWLWRDERGARKAAELALIEEVRSSKAREVALLEAEKNESVKLLADTARVLGEARDALGQTVERAAAVTGKGDLDVVMRRLELVASDLRDQRDQSRRQEGE